MAGSNRVWTSLTDDESAALEAAAEARGLRPVELVRAAILMFLRAPQDTPAPVSPGMDASIVTRLESLAGNMERQTQALQVALSLGYAAEGERNEVREALTDIAMAIGVMAGSIEPMDGGGPF